MKKSGYENKANYGISIDEYERRRANGLCAVCGSATGVTLILGVRLCETHAEELEQCLDEQGHEGVENGK